MLLASFCLSLCLCSIWGRNIFGGSYVPCWVFFHEVQLSASVFCTSCAGCTWVTLWCAFVVTDTCFLACSWLCDVCSSCVVVRCVGTIIHSTVWFAECLQPVFWCVCQTVHSCTVVFFFLCWFFFSVWPVCVFFLTSLWSLMQRNLLLIRH